MGFGMLGNALSIGLMGALVVGGSFALFGVTGKSLALVLGAVVFIVLALPFLLQKTNTNINSKTLSDSSHKSISLKEFLFVILNNKKLFYYLLGYMLITDSMATLQIYLTLYLKNVFGFTEKLSSAAGALSLVMLFLTCMILGKVSHRFKNKNKMLVIGGGIYIGAYLLFGLSPVAPMYAFASLALAGIAYGLFFPLARSIYSDIVPSDKQAEYFSSFVIFERAATIIGPIIWVVAFNLLAPYGVQYQYRGNLLILASVALLGLYFVRKALAVKPT